MYKPTTRKEKQEKKNFLFYIFLHLIFFHLKFKAIRDFLLCDCIYICRLQQQQQFKMIIMTLFCFFFIFFKGISLIIIFFFSSSSSKWITAVSCSVCVFVALVCWCRFSSNNNSNNEKKILTRGEQDLFLCFIFSSQRMREKLNLNGNGSDAVNRSHLSLLLTTKANDLQLISASSSVPTNNNSKWRFDLFSFIVQ